MTERKYDYLHYIREVNTDHYNKDLVGKCMIYNRRMEGRIPITNLKTGESYWFADVDFIGTLPKNAEKEVRRKEGQRLMDEYKRKHGMEITPYD